MWTLAHALAHKHAPAHLHHHPPNHRPTTRPPHLPARDVFNERPAGEEAAGALQAPGAAGPAVELPRGAVVHTTKGDIWLKLFPDEVGTL